MQVKLVAELKAPQRRSERRLFASVLQELTQVRQGHVAAGGRAAVHAIQAKGNGGADGAREIVDGTPSFHRKAKITRRWDLWTDKRLWRLIDNHITARSTDP